MLIKWGIIILIFGVGIYCAVLQFEKKNVKGSIWLVIGTIALSIISSFIYDNIKPFLPYPVDSAPSISTANNDIDMINRNETDSIEDNEDFSSSKSDTIPDTQEVIDPINYIKDITGQTSISGSINEEGQKNSYKFTSKVGGTYRFYTDLSAGGEVRVRISGENDETINSGTNAVTIDLEADKTYIIGIEYRNGPCDYTMNIGVPMAINDITGRTSISGSITYQDQKDRYRYTAPTSGTYRFDANLSAGGEIRVRISGENGNSLDSGINGLTINLESGKTYILSTEYRNGPCDYTISIGVPIVISDITGNTSILGNITYQDQKDKYLYTAPTSGTYRFDTDLSAGGEVRVRISGENGNSLDSGINGLTINLESGKTYILSTEYRNGPCDYTISIGVPIVISDITGNTSILGNITYQDQKDKYLYTAPTSGTYRFDTNLSAGGEVRVRISGENGNSLDSGINRLTINLEAGKTYILSIEYRNEPCSYELFIEVS